MKIALIGYGKMGKTIERLALEDGHQITHRIHKLERNEDLSLADVAIEFSIPEAAPDNILYCLEQGLAVISGTTGWLDRYQEVINKCEACNGCFVYASNFSIGVNLFFHLNRQLAQIMNSYPQYDVSMEETHHIHKLDAPSGTALTLAEYIIEARDELSGWTLENGQDNNLFINAIREGEVNGIHEITYGSEVDRISIKHQADSRDGFAKGAILAAQWSLGRQGVFSMTDVLNLNTAPGGENN
ncbi:4-hydroxy-tetrahydrodipicolinate reductase [Aureitalea marina]|uniref:4-hydroxy-tetrahydrodipicolinate reductase n=1 Tax=Aureitalea marina TaxID=930804 RepID=A0A2S7KPZ9_9FLAO|nr:4-hydroxy-tetrahydrodipicolinate reductase [Aureitalea marina]PQB04690.1 4-hydroxy-tetrahydrodipicolinate reductase [Aureitalea marina]